MKKGKKIILTSSIIFILVLLIFFLNETTGFSFMESLNQSEDISQSDSRPTTQVNEGMSQDSGNSISDSDNNETSNNDLSGHTFESEESDPNCEESSRNLNICGPKLDLENLDTSLQVTNIVLSPGENATSELGLSFHLPYEAQSVCVTVTNSNNEIINMVSTSYDYVEPLDDDVFSPFYAYEAMIKGLESGKNYTYYITADNVYSKGYNFQTSHSSTETTLLFFGDPQGYKQSQYDTLAYNCQLALTEHPSIDMIYIAGDLVDSPIPTNNWNEWNYFFTAMGSFINHIPTVTVMGNHDNLDSSQLYNYMFNYPNNGLEELQESSLYFDLENARIAIWNTEYPASFDQQASWLKEVMADATQPFKIVLMHRSPYPLSYNESYIRELAKDFEEAGIQLVLSGHDHIFSQTTMYNGQLLGQDDKLNLNNAGITYIVGGSSTGSKYYTPDTSRSWIDYYYVEKAPVYTLLTIKNDTISIDTYSVMNGSSKLIHSALLTSKKTSE